MKKPFQLWVDALLSGKYKQIRGKLKTEKGYCCLGVLCEVYNQNNTVKLVQPEDESENIAFDAECNYPPKKVITWLKNTSTMRNSTMMPFINKLVIVNDGGKTFVEIAQLIKGFFEGRH